MPKPPAASSAATGGRLTPQQQTAITLLIAGRSASSVAAALQLSRMTISRWRNHHPLFAAELARRQRDVYDTASRRLQLLMIQAIGVIDQSLRSPQSRNVSAFKVLSGLRAASWAIPAAPTDGELNEWPDDVENPVLPASTVAPQPASDDLIGTGTSPIAGH